MPPRSQPAWLPLPTAPLHSPALAFHLALTDTETTEAEAWHAVWGWVRMGWVHVCLRTGMHVCLWLYACQDYVGTAKGGIISQKQTAVTGMLSALLNTPI